MSFTHTRRAWSWKAAAILMGLCIWLTLGYVAFAQTVPASPSVQSNPVTQYRSGGTSYQTDPSGNSTIFYEMGGGAVGYTSQDAMGRITSQGTIYTPIRKPLSVDRPSIIPPPRADKPPSSEFRSIQDYGLLP